MALVVSAAFHVVVLRYMLDQKSNWNLRMLAWLGTRPLMTLSQPESDTTDSGQKSSIFYTLQDSPSPPDANDSLARVPEPQLVPPVPLPPPPPPKPREEEKPIGLDKGTGTGVAQSAGDQAQEARKAAQDQPYLSRLAGERAKQVETARSQTVGEGGKGGPKGTGGTPGGANGNGGTPGETAQGDQGQPSEPKPSPTAQPKSAPPDLLQPPLADDSPPRSAPGDSLTKTTGSGIEGERKPKVERPVEDRPGPDRAGDKALPPKAVDNLPVQSPDKKTAKPSDAPPQPGTALGEKAQAAPADIMTPGKTPQTGGKTDGASELPPAAAAGSAKVGAIAPNGSSGAPELPPLIGRPGQEQPRAGQAGAPSAERPDPRGKGTESQRAQVKRPPEERVAPPVSESGRPQPKQPDEKATKQTTERPEGTDKPGTLTDDEATTKAKPSPPTDVQQPPDSSATKTAGSAANAANGQGGSGGAGDGRAPGSSAAGENGQAAEEDVDAFSSKGSVTFRQGKVEAKFGRRVKAVRPRFGLAGQTDAMQIGRVVVVLGVTVDETGRVTAVEVLQSSGSPNNIDLPIMRAMYEWWIEPKTGKDGKAKADTMTWRIELR